MVGPSTSPPLGAGVLPASGTTLCPIAPSAHSQITVVPTVTVMSAGSNRLRPVVPPPNTWIVVAPPGFSSVAVAVNVMGELVAPVTAAVAVWVPSASPSVQTPLVMPSVAVWP